MPIHPENRDRYPADWPEISLRIKDRAGWRCECEGECEGEHGERCRMLHGGFLHLDGPARVVLTVAHLDHQPENCADSNLKAMCQPCHLRYDREHHRESRLRRRRLERAAAGQMELADAAS